MREPGRSVSTTRRTRQHGRISAAAAAAAGTLIALAVLVLLLLPRRPAATPGPALVVYCAAGIKPPVEAAARDFEQACGLRVQLQYGNSGTLLSSLRVAQAGDLYIAGDASFIRLGRAQGLLAEALPLAQLHPVIAVRAGNPRRILAAADLLRADVAVALASPEAASVGKATQQALEAAGLWAALQPRVKVFKPTVGDVANDVKLGAADAGVVWDATARQYPELETVESPLFSNAVETVTAGVLKASRQPAAALRFARFLAAPDRGQKRFAQYHDAPVAGDAWAAV